MMTLMLSQCTTLVDSWGAELEGAEALKCEQIIDQQDERSELGLERRECRWLLCL